MILLGPFQLGLFYDSTNKQEENGGIREQNMADLLTLQNTIEEISFMPF